MATLALYEGRIKDYVWLEIDDAVTQWTASVFSSDNAVAKRAIINNDPLTALNSKSKQAEVLIFNRLDPRWITFPDTGVGVVQARTSVDESGFDLPY